MHPNLTEILTRSLADERRRVAERGPRATSTRTDPAVAPASDLGGTARRTALVRRSATILSALRRPAGGARWTA